MFLLMHHFLSLAMTVSWDMYRIFDLNERHDVNKMTRGLFIKDQAISTALWMTAGALAYYIFMEIIELGGPHFYVYLLVFSISLIVLFRIVYLRYIAPLFNKYTTLEEYEGYDPVKKEELTEGLNRLSERSGFDSA